MVDQIDKNFHLHFWKIASQTAGMKAVHSNSLSYVDSGLSSDTFNVIHIQNGSKLTPEAMDSTLSYFKERQLKYCVWINKENLTEQVESHFADAPLSLQNEEKGMALELSSYQILQNTQHNRISIVNNRDLLSDYASVIASNWSPRDENVMCYYQNAATGYLNPDNGVQLLVYYQEGTPVSTVELFATDHETVGAYGFATLQTHRGKGIGSALLTFAMNQAKEQGYKYLILQASEDGIGIYRRFGFKEYTTYFEYA